MEITEVRNFCLEFPFAEESTPFGENTLVYKLVNKIYAILNLDRSSVSVKCDPERALELRESYSSVFPGYHLNKKHWNTITIPSDLPEIEFQNCITHSYLLIKNSLSMSIQKTLDESC